MQQAGIQFLQRRRSGTDALGNQAKVNLIVNREAVYGLSGTISSSPYCVGFLAMMVTARMIGT